MGNRCLPPPETPRRFAERVIEAMLRGRAYFVKSEALSILQKEVTQRDCLMLECGAPHDHADSNG